MRGSRVRRGAALGAALLVLGATAIAAQAREAGAGCTFLPFPAAGSCAVVDDEQLGELRGGFESGGLHVSFGFERVTYINDTLVANAAFHLPEVARISPDQAAQLQSVFGRLQLIQNGEGNVFEPMPVPGVGAGTVIQNTLNDQTIRQSTTLQVVTNGLQFLRSANALATLHEVLTSPPAR